MDWLMEVPVVVIFSAFGLITNLFILMTLRLQLKQGGPHPTEYIVSSLAIANIITIIVSVTRMAVASFHKYCEIQQKVINTFLFLLHSMSFWMSSFLCLFYCLKIISIHWPTAIKLVQIITARTGLLLGLVFATSFSLGALAGYLINASPTCYYENGTYYFHAINESLSGHNDVVIQILNTYIDLILGSILPAICMSTSSFWIVFVLCKHRRISHNLATSVNYQKHNRHKRIILMIICLYLLFHFILFTRIIVLTCAILSSSSCFIALWDLIRFTYFYAAFAYAVGNPMIIIFGISKLRVKMFQVFRVFSLHPQSIPRENGGSIAFEHKQFSGVRGIGR